MNSNEEVILNSIQDLHNYFNAPNEVKHPLITLIDFSKVNRKVYEKQSIKMNLYSIIESDKCACKLTYGQTPMDFANGTLVFFSPGQTMNLEAADYRVNNKTGWGLYFHPEFIKSSYLSETILNYSYFDYQLSEALHLSCKEKDILKDLTIKIEEELCNNIDKHSKDLVIATIDLILKYCNRFYDRQFMTRENNGNKTVTNFKKYIKEFLNKDTLSKEGGLSVQRIANHLNLSPNYLSDLLKKETGKNATEHIQLTIVDYAKTKLINTSNTVQEIAYSLGFEYPQSFTKMFKNATGYTPTVFRNMN